MMEAFIKIAKQFGIFAALVCLFMWRDIQREERMNAQITQLQGQVISIQKDSIEATNRLASSVDKLTDTLRNEQARRDVSASVTPVF